jgi:dienelactone hydrolase
MPKMSRRELGLAVAAGRAAKAAETRYTGALDGFEAKVSPATFDPVAYTRSRWSSAPLKMTFRATNAKETLAWQKKLRPKIASLLGGFPAERTPLRPATLETREFAKYRREKIVFETRPGVSVLAYLLTPKNASGKLATAICVPGHGRGVDDIVGVDQEGKDRTNKSGYQHDFAIQTVELGMAAVAIEPMGFGCRRDGISKSKGLGTSACQPSAGAALLLGETMCGWRVWDVMRTIDWIATRPELDAERVGCMGISGGGTVTLFASALDTRIRAALVSGYLNTFRDSILSLSHCIDNYIPGILEWAEMYDVAGLIAPRALFAESGENDRIFPVAAARESFAKVRQVYETMGAADRTGHEVFPDEHVFHGVRGLPFLKQHLTA